MKKGKIQLYFVGNLTIFFFLFSCGLKYTPIETPIDKENQRKQIIINQLTSDFENQNLKYLSYGFGKSYVLKPPSFYILDSLYEVKYQLYKKNIKADKSLNDKIAIQQNIVNSDTGSVYYIENHIFTVKKDSTFDVFYAEILLDQQNKISKMKILESPEIEKKLIDFYACYKFRESFLYPHLPADEAELAFYDLYEEKIQSLTGSDKDEFLNFMLSVMKTAYRISSLDKSELIKEYVRNYIHGRNYHSFQEEFVKMEEISDENYSTYYDVIYQYSTKDENKIEKFELYLNPYLQLIKINKIE